MAHGDVSVIIPNYNRRNLVRRAIDSVLAQTHAPNEIIVVDDGSQDGSAEFLRRSYGTSIQLIEQENGGASSARNRGIMESTADLIAFLDSDDVWDPDKLEIQVPLLRDPQVVLTYSNYRYENMEGDAFSDAGLSLCAEQTVFSNPIELLTRPGDSAVHLCGTLCRRKQLINVGMFDVNLRIAEDTKLFFSMAKQGAFAVTRRPLWTRQQISDELQLTTPWQESWHRNHADAVMEILRDCWTDKSIDSPVARRNLRKLLAYFTLRQAKFDALDGRFAAARRRAIQSIRYEPFRKTLAQSAIIALAPSTARRLIARRSASRVSQRVGGR
jgi:glycosyltransferase involved in cell wall biosynthesis